MARELKHASVGTDLSQTEWESINSHSLDSGVAGDLLYFDGSHILGLGLGTSGQVLTAGASAPGWSSTLGGITLTSPTITGALTSTGLSSSPAIGANSALVSWGGTITEAASGAHARLALLDLTAPTVTGAGATVTDTATLYISGAMTATVTGSNYALWVDSGAVQLDSTLGVGSTLTVQGGGLVVQAGGSTIQAGGLNVQAGGGSFTGGVTVVTGNLSLSGTGQRILGDFNNSTVSSRLQLQSINVNASTSVGIIPNGTSNLSAIWIHNGSDPDNSGRMRIVLSGTAANIQAQFAGTGSIPTTFGFLAFTSYSFDNATTITAGGLAVTGGITATTGNLTITAGNLTFGGSAQRITGDFSTSTVANRVMFQSSTTNGATNLSLIPNGTSVITSHRLYSSSSDPANASVLNITMQGGGSSSILSVATGTGTILPLVLSVSGGGTMTFFTGGGVTIGDTTDPGSATVRLAGAVTPTSWLEYTEIADPAAPAANKARLYARDNGSGKTQMVVRFPTGAIQVLSTEP